jgi:hypothetical protein
MLLILIFDRYNYRGVLYQYQHLRINEKVILIRVYDKIN